MSVARMPRAEQFAQRIVAQQSKCVESILEVGRLLLAAKRELAHGEWGRLFDERLIPFGRGTGERLMVIASHRLLSNAAHAPHLPPSWMTLYELTKVPEPTLKNALRDGLITSHMQRKAIVALQPPRPTKPKTGDLTPMLAWADDKEHRQITAALEPLRKLLREWPDDQSYTSLVHALEQIVKHVQRLEAQREQVSA